jgi:undecaprenyl-diphosphatase
MPLYQAVILALVQGLTEFLPVSSTAHLVLVPWLLHWKDPGLPFDIALHVGTLAAVIVYFFRDWVTIFSRGLGVGTPGESDLDGSPRLLWWLAAATVPIGVAGLLFKHQIEESWRSPVLMAIMLIVVGLVMAAAEKFGKRTRGVSQMGLLDALLIGLSQALAIVPGTSRSGITISTGLFRNLDRAAAARFSFLLSTPATAAAALKGFYDLYKHGGIAPELRLAFGVGIFVSALSGWLVIAVLMKFLRRQTFYPFVAYRFALAILILVLASRS